MPVSLPELKLPLPYITDALPGIGGALRATPEDFVVEELPLYAPSGEGTHLYMNVTRSEMTTRDMVAAIAQAAKVGAREIGYAGLKDKYARTTQTFSIPMRQGAIAADVDALTARVAEGLPDGHDCQINWSALHGNKLKVGHLLGNRFAIVIRAIELPPGEAMARAVKIAEAICAHGVPNFIGAQRFGMHGDNAEVGYEIVTGTRRVREKWLRSFLITSCQSHMCNLYLARRVEAGDFGRILAGDVAKKYETGGIFVVDDATVDQARYDAREISFTAPMYGFKMKRATAEAALLEEEIAAETGITDAQWRMVQSEGTRRMGRLLVDELTVAEHSQGSENTQGLEKSQAVEVRFTLPKGAFATTILREFMKGEGEVLPPQEIDE